jgi:hypothetical protein
LKTPIRIAACSTLSPRAAAKGAKFICMAEFDSSTGANTAIVTQKLRRVRMSRTAGAAVSATVASATM